MAIPPGLGSSLLALNRKYQERSGGPSAIVAERSGAPTVGLQGRKAGTDHAAVVHDHRHEFRKDSAPANPGRAAPQARKRGSRRINNFGFGASRALSYA